MTERIIYWIPRILNIIALLFMLLFSFDVFEGNDTLWHKILGFIMHSIPVIILACLLVLAWYREFVGGILIFAVTLAGCFYFRSFTTNPYSLVILVPFMLTGAIFVIHHFLYRKAKAD
ncbi:MAG TPA: hypothetical protein VMT63_08070 [Bacteroidales bacterium]|nr:hypothetical protein [Bacteroidales bacterium]